MRLCLLALLLAVSGQFAMAQQPDTSARTVAAVPVLTLDFDRLFAETRWGKRIAADMARETAALSTENNRIANDLIAEEKDLTDRRAKLTPEAFRAEANAFDERATGIRAAQKAKAQALSQSLDASRQAFYEALAPLIDEVLAGRGAVMLLDRRAIIRSLEAADITDDLAQRVDARFGDGPAETPPAPPTASQGPGKTGDQ